MIAVGGENLIDLVSTSSKEGLPVYIAHPGGRPDALYKQATPP